MRKSITNMPIPEKLFSKWTLFLCLGGLVINIALSKLVAFFQLPLYMDNVGSILVGALGGILPGIIVGFLSNIINSITNPISMYYGIITVAIAYLAAGFSAKGYFTTWQGRIKILPYYVFLGGVVGSLFTWMLFGGNISGIAEPYAHYLVNSYGFEPFLAQLCMDTLIDIPDKLLTILLVAIFLQNYPAFLYDKFPFSYLYDRSPEKAEAIIQKEQGHFRVESLDRRMVRMVVVVIALVSISSVIISTVYHHARLSDSYANQATIAAKAAAELVKGDRVEEFAQQGRAASGYVDVEQKLYRLRADNKLLKYIYIYQVTPAGMKVVFDLDEKDLAGSAPGSMVPDEDGFNERISDFITGNNIVPEFSNGPYGYLMSAYAPIKNSQGKIVAYAGADIGMKSYVEEMLVFVIQVIAIIFGLTVVIAFLALWYVREKVTHPLNSIMGLVNELDKLNPEQWLESGTWQQREKIFTGDEIENLYNSICKMEENSAHYVKRIIETEQQLAASKELALVNLQLKEAIAKADEATKVKSEFYSRMSHDMRTPMNGIMGLVALSKDEQDSQVLRRNMEKIGSSSRYLLGLINDTLDVSRMESKKMELASEPIILEDFVDSILTMLRPTLALKNLNFEYEIKNVPQGQVVLGDEMRLKQIFMNLFSNAAKFTPNNGLIKVVMEQTETTPDTVVEKVQISDSGYGMSKHFLEQGIFKAFSQERNAVTSEYAGTGLGLAIVKNLVDLMGGTITVESQLGEGTTFTLVIPYKLAKNQDIELKVIKEKQTQEKEQIDLSLLQGRTVLLCEDHPLNTEIVIRLLKKRGVNVEHAVNGKEGVEMFAASTLHHFDAVLMDIRMPIMNGLEASAAIRKLNREDGATVPIIAMTANAFAEDIAASAQAGMNAHLAKPINPPLLFKTLAEKIAQSQNC